MYAATLFIDLKLDLFPVTLKPMLNEWPLHLCALGNAYSDISKNIYTPS